jgi:hypothetical protein
MIGLQKEVMPHVRFETKDYGRNEEASKQTGRHVPLRATFIVITSHGSKDSVEQIADEWIPRKRLEASRGNYNDQWVDYFERQYEAWKKGHELPREGTPILTWGAISPEANVRLRSIGIQVVEDLAAVPDSGLGTIGLDGRYLRDLARGWIAESKDKGINAKAIADASAEIRQLREQNEQLTARLDKLESKRRKDSEAA